MKTILRSVSAILFTTSLVGSAAPAFPAPAASTTGIPGDLVWSHSMTTGEGVSSYYRFTVRAKNRTHQTLTWKVCLDSGFDPGFSPTMGTVEPGPYGWDDISIPFSPPVGACAGMMAGFTIKLCADGMEIARNTGCISITGNKAGIYYPVVEPQESHNFVGDKGLEDRIEFVVKNDELDFLPHAYDFLLFNENDLAPGLDLYELTPVSGFDLPTVIGSGTPLMSGKLAEIPPGDELLVEIEITPIALQLEGAGNLTTLVVADDDMPGETVTSSATVVRCSGSSAEATFRGGRGLNDACFLDVGQPVVGRDWLAAVDANGTLRRDPSAWTIVLVSDRPAAALLAAGELLVDVRAPLFASVVTPDAHTGIALHRTPLPRGAGLDGARLFAQAAVVTPGSVELCNALELELAPEQPDYRCTFHEAPGRQPF